MVTVRLILYGLIAFVPNSNDSPTTYTALLVDARTPQYASDGCRIPSHAPALYAMAGQCKANGAACTMSRKIEQPTAPAISGSWSLDHESLSVEVVTPSGKHVRRLITVQGQKAASTLPSTPEESSSLHWIPEMQTLLATQGKRASVNPDCLGSAENCPISARLAINDGRVSSCHLAQEPEQKKIYPYEFRALNASTRSTIVQAVSDAVMVTLQIPSGSKIQIVSRDLAAISAVKPKRTIVLGDGGKKTIDVWLTNVPEHDHLMAGNSCDKSSMSIDRHFELYYNLVAEPIPFTQRVVPYRHVTPEIEAVISQVRQPQGEDSCPLLKFPRPSRYPTDLRSCGNIQLTAPPPS